MLVRYLIPMFLFVMISCSTLNKQVPTQNNQLISLTDFFKNPEKAAFKLSPNGEYFSFIAPYKNRLNIFIQKSKDTEVKRITSSIDRDITMYFWKGNDSLIYLKDNGGDENYHVFLATLNGETKDLTPFEKVRAGIIDDLEDIDNEILLSMNKRDPTVFDVFRLNIKTGEMKEIAKNPGNIVSWITDHAGSLRLAIESDGVNKTVKYRKNESTSFETIVSTNFKDQFSPIMFSYDNKSLYVSSNINRDKAIIVQYNPDTKKEIKKIFEHPDVDVEDIFGSKKRKVLTGVVYETDKVHYHFFDKTRALIQKELEHLISNKEVVVTSMNKNEDKVIAAAYSDKARSSYYFYNVTTKEFYKLADAAPWLNENKLSSQTPINYKSRDGLTINGYLTVPNGKEPKSLPIIINPHGGPWARDSWGFNPEVQFLANRGYAVLQINFRGSTGYGKKFWKKSFKQWGKTMQDDITDGVNWLVSKGIADPKRICIYGGSYGGYATLAGIAFTPDLYACAIDYVGVSNLFTFLKTIPPYWKPMLEQMYEMVGNPEKDIEYFKAASPVFHVDKIKTPLFVAQGKNDPRVNIAESDQIVTALKAKGIYVEYMVKDNEGHGFHNEENRFDFYRAMEIFLAKYLGRKAE